MNDQLYSPCPGSRSSFGNEKYDTWNDDTLDNLEYTAAINFPPEPRAPSLTKAKPRRALKTSSFAIHEDSQPNITGDTTTVTKKSTLKRKTQDGGPSILAQPAQRFQRPRVSFAEASNNNTLSKAKKIMDSIGKRDMKGPDFQPEQKSQINQKPSESNALKKDVRRRTVYIPTEDTTMPTVFMSLFSPLKSTDANINNNTASQDDTVPIYSLEARIAAKKTSRMSSAGKKPTRAPLQQSKKAIQQSTIVRDVLGKNGGKENIPPGYTVDEKKCTGEKDPSSISKEPRKRASRVMQSARTNVLQPRKNDKPACKPIGEKSSTILMARSDIKDMNASLSKKQDVKRSSANSRSTLHSRGSKESLSTTNRSAAPTQLSVPKVRPVSIDQQYPRFDNDISNPVMYEDDWLSHQEVVITQLVNGLFDSVGGKLHVQDPEVLRHELLHIYQSDAFLLLYKRLQASILYGALAPPKDILRRGSRLPDDLGLKKSFLNFWSNTYDLHALRGAAEAVVGRKMTIQSIRTSGGTSDSLVKQQKALKRAIEAFLDTFIIRNMDKEENGDMQSDVAGGPYRQTLLRSIMMIALLDKARLAPGNSLPQSLFASSSPYKSSSTALQALANIVLPSMGDINRQVNHLDCQLSYRQHQLQDYEYRIHNLAVDLRDGVILTRLVEVLLYPSASHLHAKRESIGASTSTDSFLSEDETTEYPLSQNIKFPCISRATKIFNVQIALDALKGVTGINAIATELCAEHIVDGYREKTIALLWLLVGKWGLAEMLDWDDARNEIARLQKKLALCQDGQDSKAQNLRDLVFESHEDLLIKWASTLAQLKGLRLVNLTTSFADGRIFESIIDEYECFILGRQTECEDMRASRADKGSLQSRLQALGCSTQFASLVAGSTSTSRIFDRDFVLGALTFLCSRLLSSSKRIRAAITIQTAWRRVTRRQNQHRRQLAKDIAEQCAAVACTRERILWAKTVIVKWWREQKTNKSKRKNKNKTTAPMARNTTKPSRRPPPRLLEKRANY